MYDGDEDDEEEVIEDYGPASGGYGGEVVENVFEEEEDPETARREAAEVARGKEDRSFYDNLAKEEDARHNAMRKDVAKRSLAVGELRQKLRHKEAELHALLAKIRIEEDRIDFEKKKAYRAQALPIDPATGQPIPILAKDTSVPADITEEFSIERAIAHIKQLQEQHAEEEKELREMLEHMHEEERALSQLQHQVMRM